MTTNDYSKLRNMLMKTILNSCEFALYMDLDRLICRIVMARVILSWAQSYKEYFQHNFTLRYF